MFTKLLKASVPKCQRIQDNTGIKYYFLYFKNGIKVNWAVIYKNVQPI